MTQNVLLHSWYDPSGLSWHRQSWLYENDKPACLSHQQAAAKKKQSIGSSHLVPVISSKRKMKPALRIGVIVAALFVTAMLIWQGVTAHGAPDPMRPNTSQTVAFLDIGILVFREGLECILVLAAITASMTGAKSITRKRARRRDLAVAPLVWIGPARIHLSISGRIRGRSFSAELSSEAGRGGGAERGATRTDAHGNGSRADICSSAASAVPQNANHYRHSPRGSVAGDGRRASAGNAAGALDFYYSNQFAERLHATLDGPVVCSVPDN